MPQSLAQVYIHIVYSTKYRTPFLLDASLREKTHAYLAGVSSNHECPAVIVGGTENHVHALCRLSKNLALKALLQETKRSSSLWIRHENPQLAEFQWQAGYGTFSVGASEVETVTAYIRKQAQHHRTESFKDEFRRLLRENGTEWDERYVWN